MELEAHFHNAAVYVCIFFETYRTCWFYFLSAEKRLPLSARAMADQVAKGEEFEKKAEKKLKGWGIFGSKYDDAADLFDKAGNCYKLAKACKIPRFLFLS